MHTGGRGALPRAVTQLMGKLRNPCCGASPSRAQPPRHSAFTASCCWREAPPRVGVLLHQVKRVTCLPWWTKAQPTPGASSGFPLSAVCLWQVRSTEIGLLATGSRTPLTDCTAGTLSPASSYSPRGRTQRVSPPRLLSVASEQTSQFLVLLLPTATTLTAVEVPSSRVWHQGAHVGCQEVWPAARGCGRTRHPIALSFLPKGF